MNKEQATELIIKAYRELAEDLDLGEIEEPTAQTELFGAKSQLDSVGLVSLISEVEQVAEEQTGKQIVLTDERAMSRSRSPFRSIETLAEYLCECLNEDSKNA